MSTLLAMILPEPLLGGLAADAKPSTDLSPGVPAGSGSAHGGGKFGVGLGQLVIDLAEPGQHVHLERGWQPARGDQLAHGEAAGITGGTQQYRSVGHHRGQLTVRPLAVAVGAALAAGVKACLTAHLSLNPWTIMGWTGVADREE